MNRKSIVIYSIVAAALLCGVCFLFFHLYKNGDNDKNKEDSGKIVALDGAAAIPSDAIFLLESEEFKTLKEITDDGSALKDFFECIPDHSDKWRAFLSLHYSMKKKVAPLFVLEIPESVNLDEFEADIRSKCRNVINKKYSSRLIYKSSIPNISFILYRHYLIASPSIIIVETSLRHLDNKTSFIDNPLYKNASCSYPGDAKLNICNRNTGKLFSGVAAGKYLHYAEFAQHFADWTTLALDKAEGVLNCRGTFYDNRGEGNFSNVLLSQKMKKSELFPIVPYNANFVMTIPLTSYKDYLASYRSYLEANKKMRDYNYVNVIAAKNYPSEFSTFETVKRLAPKELSVFSINDDAGNAKNILAINCGNSEFMEISPNEISSFRYRGYIPAVFGDAFAPSTDSHCLLKDDWLIVGGEKELQSLKKIYSGLSYFSLEEYLLQTPAADEIHNPASFIFAVNTGRFSDSLSSALRENYSKRLSAVIGKKNFEFSFLTMQKAGTHLDASFAFYSEDLNSLPVPASHKKAGKGQPLVTDGGSVVIFGGPFEVKNFKDGSTNYLIQKKNTDISLLNSEKHPVWTVKFNGRICGTVRQIDYLKNNKLQMLFGSGNKVWLLDRLGRKVGKFPVTLEKEILLGPDVYDFSKKKDYEMVILHKDNAVGRYDLNGRKIEGWNFEIPLEKITSLPEIVNVGNERYWILRTPDQTLIYNDKGSPVIDFSKKKRIRKDSRVEAVSSEALSVTGTDGREMILNVKNGTLKKK